MTRGQLEEKPAASPTLKEPASPAQFHYEVVCVCGGYGFPSGTGSAARIIMVGKALREAGISFRLLHCGPSSVPSNTRSCGVHEGIPFQYTTWTKRPKNALLRALVYARAFLELAFRIILLVPQRRRTAIYLYVMIGPLNLYVGLLSKLLGIPLVQELCEWWPGEPTCSSFTKWLHRRPMFRLATGVLAISKLLEYRVRKYSAKVNPGLPVYRLPSVVDARRFARALPYGDEEDTVPHFLWCGTFEWIEDIQFAIRALVMVKRCGHACQLKIIGSHGEQARASITAYASEQGLSPSDVIFTGFVTDRELESAYKSAAGLLLPLWKNDRSRTRMPNKLGEYLASGRPVITSGIGDLTDFLVDGVNAYVGEPGNEKDFAERMIAILRNGERASRIGAKGQEACFAHLDYRAHVQGLGEFFAARIAQGRQTLRPSE